jgi:hypothetical protein
LAIREKRKIDELTKINFACRVVPSIPKKLLNSRFTLKLLDVRQGDVRIPFMQKLAVEASIDDKQE